MGDETTGFAPDATAELDLGLPPAGPPRHSADLVTVGRADLALVLAGLEPVLGAIPQDKVDAWMRLRDALGGAL